MMMKKRITILCIVTIVILLITPLLVNAAILPKNNVEYCKYFNGEWFNKTNNLKKEEFNKLDRWAHYCGKHGCEPEKDNCNYRGLIGSWKLMIDYIKEDKTFPSEFFRK